MNNREGGLIRSVRVLRHCIDNMAKSDDPYRIAGVIEGILIANDIIDTELKWEYKEIVKTRYSMFYNRRTYTEKETYTELMLRLAKEAIPILLDN